jgi:hypothetical protein
MHDQRQVPPALSTHMANNDIALRYLFRRQCRFWVVKALMRVQVVATARALS